MDWDGLIDDATNLADTVDEAEETYRNFLSDVGNEADDLLENVRSAREDVMEFAENLWAEGDEAAVDAAAPEMRRVFSNLQEMEADLERMVTAGRRAEREEELTGLSDGDGLERLVEQMKTVAEGLEGLQKFSERMG